MTAVDTAPAMKTSLIISTYNWPEALQLCLLSVSRQSLLPDEVIVADDGSTRETAELISKLQETFPVPLIHVWQEDEGFQLAKIRNKAIARASGEYVIQVDGDLILHKHFVKDHTEFAKPDTFVTGSRVLTNRELSEKLLRYQKVTTGLLESGMSNHANRLRVKFLRNYFAFRYKPQNIHDLRGCNMAFWRDDLIRVNGYNEEFYGWGKEDNEIAARLVNAGVLKQTIKFGGIVFHIYHPEQSRARCPENENRLAHTIENKVTYCPAGLNQYNPSRTESRLPLISIILVTRNAENYLQRCLDSIFRQEYPFIELIVMDGASTDSTTEILRANSEKITLWKSEADQGTYDAMNKALDHIRGQWVYFIGADDELTPEFSKLARELKNPKAIYYGSVWKDGKKYLGRLTSYLHAKTGINHQAMIYPASVFQKYRFNTAYAISADHILNMWCWKDRHYRFEFRDHVIATFNHTGVSSLYKDQLFEKKKAQFILQNYGTVIWMRFMLKKLKSAANSW